MGKIIDFEKEQSRREASRPRSIADVLDDMHAERAADPAYPQLFPHGATDTMRAPIHLPSNTEEADAWEVFQARLNKFRSKPSQLTWTLAVMAALDFYRIYVRDGRAQAVAITTAIIGLLNEARRLEIPLNVCTITEGEE